jgi:uncharacterized protein (TIGR03643 family)
LGERDFRHLGRKQCREKKDRDGPQAFHSSIFSGKDTGKWRISGFLNQRLGMMFNNHLHLHTMATALTPEIIDRIIQMAWEDRTPFEAIEVQFGLPEKAVITLMRREMKRSSFDMWRQRVHGRATKHRALRDASVDRFKCNRQRAISSNKISKR